MSSSTSSNGKADASRERRPAGGATPPPAPVHDLIALTDEQRASIEVLIVDDEQTLRDSCASLLRSEGYPVTVVGRGHEALQLVSRKRFDILLLDLHMCQVSGHELLLAARKAFPDSLVIMMTGNPSVESSVAVLRDGAWDYLPKPFSATHFQVLMGRASHAVMVARESDENQPNDEVEEPGEAADVAPDTPELMGRSAPFRRLIETARKVASTDASVFLTGESGAGKEVIAQFIHANSRRSSRPLIALNCAAIPEQLIESEMFGHVEGAFTGAVKAKPGLLEAANGGALFLDELTEMPMPLQAKILRVLQDGVVRRVGSTTTDAVVNVRFIAATNRDPALAIREGRLRKDLFYRLRVVPLDVPPLRARRDDIPLLARSFLTEFWKQHRMEKSNPPTLADDAMETLVRAPWPGNVRELRNVIEHLAVMTPPGSEIGADDIPFLDGDVHAGDDSASLFSSGFLDMDYHTAREQVLAEFESHYLRHIVKAAGGNISDAARMAGVDRTTLYRLMDKHDTRPNELLQDESPVPGNFA